MKINRRLLPLKIHYFFFLGCMSPILPFLIVVAMQLGIPISVQGTLGAITLLTTVLAKPIIAAVADTFPKYRKAIFLALLTLMISAYCSVWFIPPMRDLPVLKGQLVKASAKTNVSSQVPSLEIDTTGKDDYESQPIFMSHTKGSCYIAVAWDCVASCSDPWMCLGGNETYVKVKVRKIDDANNILSLVMGSPESYFDDDSLASNGSVNIMVSNSSADEPLTAASGHLYKLEGVNISWELLSQNISLECARAEWSGENCQAVWHYWEFWIYVCLLLVGQISFNTGNSITDAIAVDSIGEDQGNYGNQRAWGTVGWGLMGPISGLLIDLWSGSSITKDHTPAFLICFFLGSIDILTCASTLKVPQIGDKSSVLQNVGPLLRQPRFFIFCCFVILNGCYDGIVACFIFAMQEKMAQGTSAMKYMKFLQGFTLFVQCSIEAPFMFIYGWFLRRLGAQRVTSLVFFLYIFRLLGLALVGYYGPVWATLLTELLNGPCYGLGYTAIVVYSAKISPPGTSTTVQSIINICYESFGYALAAFGGGLLFEALGGPGMYMVAGVASAVTFVLHLVSLKFLPPPEEHSNGVTEPGKRPSEDPAEEQLALNENENSCMSHRGSVESAATVLFETSSVELE